MIDTSALPANADHILVTRLDGLGDIVVGMMLLSGLHAKWPSAKITLVVRPQMANIGAILPDWVEVVALPFDPREPIAERQETIIQQLQAFCDRWTADLAVIAEFNRTWAGEIVAASCGASRVLAFDGPTGLNFLHHPIRSAMKVRTIADWQTFHANFDDREVCKYIAFLDGIGLTGKDFAPTLCIREEDRSEAAELWRSTGVAPENAVVFFPSSSDLLARSLSAKTWSRWIKHVSAARPVVLLGSRSDEPALDEVQAVEQLNASRVTMPTEKIGVTAAFLERAGAVIAMDTGPMHLAAALGSPTLGVFGGGYRAQRFLPVGRRTCAIRMPIGCYGCEWHCPFDTRLCIRNIPEGKIFEAGDAFLADANPTPDIFTPHIFDIAPPAELNSVLLGPMMRQYRHHLKLNHEVMEHHAFIATVQTAQSAQLNELNASIVKLMHENHLRSEGIKRVSDLITQISADNAGRDEAIAQLNATIAEMTRQNNLRNEGIAHINKTLEEMSRVNVVRDEAISIVTKRTDPPPPPPPPPPKKSWFPSRAR